MASLTGQSINTSYQGLIKTTDNAAISGTAKALTDGTGNALPVEVSTTSMIYSGTQDFTSATVLGIGGGGTPSHLESYITNGKRQSAGWGFPPNWATPFAGREGQTLQQFTIAIHTAFPAGATADFYIYDTQWRTSPSAGGMVYPYQKIATIALSVPIDVAGDVTVTISSPITLPSTGIYYVYAVQSTDSTGLWLEGSDSIDSGNGWWSFVQGYNPYNANASYAGRHWFLGASAGAPATLPADGTGFVDLVRPPFYYFKYN